MRLRLVFVVLFALLSAAPALAASVRVTIDLSDQQMTVAVGGDVRHRWPVSTGRSGYPTPTGTYHPIRMYRSYYSIKYDNAPMPWAIFFRGGYAIHGTTEVRSLGRAASHGCVRLHPDNARVLYNLVLQHGRASTTIRIRR